MGGDIGRRAGEGGWGEEAGAGGGYSGGAGRGELNTAMTRTRIDPPPRDLN